MATTSPQPQEFSTTSSQTQQFRAMPILIALLRRDSAFVQCPYCSFMGFTTIKYKCGLGTFMISGIMCASGFGILCSLIPFCFDQAKDVTHWCSHCQQPLATHALV